MDYPQMDRTQTDHNEANNRPLRPGRAGIFFILFIYATVLIRSLAWPGAGLILWRLGLIVLFLSLYLLILIRPGQKRLTLHLYFSCQSVLILVLLSLEPHLDFYTALFGLLSYQAALVFGGRSLWLWCGLFILAATIGLVVYFGLVLGLAIASSTIAGCLIFPALVLTRHDLEQRSAASQALLLELQATNQQLQTYAAQAEELAAVNERNQAARVLHDSVSQTLFGVVLTARAAQILLERDPEKVAGSLAQLQALTHSALAEMRSFIGRLRPQAPTDT